MSEEAIPKGWVCVRPSRGLSWGLPVAGVHGDICLLCATTRASWSSQRQAGVLECEPMGSKKARMQKGMT